MVVDASVVFSALVEDDEHAMQSIAEIFDHRLVAPEILDLEVLSTLRRFVQHDRLSAGRAEEAVLDLDTIPIARRPHKRLLPRIWELRQNVTPYDAAYVALAEFLNAPLVTRDARLASAPGARCDFRLIPPTI